MDEYDSGPFCRHWGDPSDCDEKCKCGHECRQHSIWDNSCRECDCESFVDVDDSGTISD